MSKLYFFKKRETKRTILQKNSTPSVLRAVLIISFWLLSIGIVRSQTAPNISYTTPQTYLLNAGITNLSPTNSGGTVPALTYKEVSTFAGTTSGFLDGTGTTAKMDGPLGMTLDANGDVYFIDSVNHRIRKMTTVDNVTTVTTIAGDGYSFLFFGRLRNNASGSLASFNYPADLALDTANNCLYVTDKENDVIRKVSLTAPYPVTTFAGSGTSTSTDNTGVLATFKKPSGIVIDPTGTYLYVTDRGGNKIRRITISTAQVTTIAGSGTAGTADNATGTAATFNDPTGIAVDADYIYITDFGGHKIRKISKTSPYPVSTIAGSGTKSSVDHATGTSATFDNPYGMTLDGAGNLLVAEWGNKIRKITPAGVVTTIAGSGVASSLNGNGALATFDSPSNIVINPATGIGYVSEYTGDRIRKIELGGYTISPTLPLGLSFDVTTGVISGNPTAINNGPSNYTITAYNYYGTSETTVAITTANLPTIATTAVTLITGTTATSGGSGIATNGSDLLEKGVCWSTSANPTILDSKLIEGATAATSFTSSLTGLATSTTYYIRAYATNSVGTGYGNEVSFTTSVAPPNISYPPNIDAQVGSAISTISGTNTGGIVSSSGGVVTTFAGSTRGNIDGTGPSAQFNRPYKITSDNLNNLFVVDILNNNIRKITPNGVVTTYFIPNGITPMGIVCDASGNLYVTSPQHHRIYKITSAGAMSVFAGSGVLGLRDGLSSEAMFSYPWGLTMDATGTIFVTEVGNHCIRRIDPDGVVSLVAGNGSVGSNDGTYGVLSSFSNPRGITCDAFGNLFVADSNNHRIRKITSSGSVSTIAGGSSTSGNTDGLGTAAKFYGPSDLCIDNKGNLFVADVFNHKIRKITPNGLVSTVAGSLFGYEDGSISVAKFNNPASLTLDSQGNILIADDNNSKIRKITFDGYTISPSLPAGLVFSNETGTISGTPQVVSPTTTYTITATNSGGSSSTIVNITVTDASTTPTWTGTEWINGTATAATPAIIEGNYTSGGDLEVGELTIKNNATVVFQSGHNLTINGKLTVESGSELLLESNANLVQTTNDTNSGLITIKRNTAPLKRLDYVLWSSPVTGQQLQSFSPATLSNRFYTYDGTTNVYSAVSSPNTTDFEKGTGFLIRMPNDHPTTSTIWTGTFTGVPNNGYLTVIVNTGGYTALGNPYPSTMDADAFIDANSITEALYFWRKTNNSDNPSYATYTKAGGVGTANSADPNGLIPNGVIQVGQGFIAAVNYIDAVFTNAMRTTNNGNQFLKTKKTDKSRIWLNLTNDSGFFSQTLVAYMDKATSGIDAAIDGRYFNDSKTALTSIIKNEEFTIQGRSLPFDASDVVPLGFKTETAGDFTLAIDHTDGLFATGQKVFLKDNLTNTLHDLSTGSYAFTSAAGVFNTRFEFRYQQALGTIENELEANAIVVYKQNDKIKIDAGTQNIAGVKVYDIGGRLLVERKDINANTALIAVNGTTQVLLVHVITQEGSVVIKKMIQ
nr:putative Ig domain-containing protein [uncultured Flavobacterium sp.]